MKLLSLPLVLLSVSSVAAVKNINAGISKVQNVIRISPALTSEALAERLSSVNKLSELSSFKRQSSECQSAIMEASSSLSSETCSIETIFSEDIYNKLSEVCASGGCLPSLSSAATKVLQKCSGEFDDNEMLAMMENVLKMIPTIADALCTKDSNGEYCASSMASVFENFDPTQMTESDFNSICSDCSRKIMNALSSIAALGCKEAGEDCTGASMITNFICLKDYNNEYCLPKIMGLQMDEEENVNIDDFVAKADEAVCKSNCMQRYLSAIGNFMGDDVGGDDDLGEALIFLNEDICATNAKGDTCLSVIMKQSMQNSESESACENGLTCSADDACLLELNPQLESIGCCSGLLSELFTGEDSPFSKACNLLKIEDACEIEKETVKITIKFDSKVDLSKINAEELKAAIKKDVAAYIGNSESVVTVNGNTVTIEVKVPKSSAKNYSSVSIGSDGLALSSSSNLIISACSSTSFEECMSSAEVSAASRVGLFAGVITIGLLSFLAQF